MSVRVCVCVFVSLRGAVSIAIRIAIAPQTIALHAAAPRPPGCLYLQRHEMRRDWAVQMEYCEDYNNNYESSFDGQSCPGP